MRSSKPLDELRPAGPGKAGPEGSSPAVPALLVSNLTVSYQGRPALRSVSFELAQGKMAAVIGPNGAGKTTLIHAILGLARADAGRIEVLGMPVDQARNRIAFVPQKESVDWDFPVTVEEAALMGRYGRLGFFGRLKKADRAAALDALEAVGMADFRNRHIRMLSGGQQQRVFIARALCQGAGLFFLDEPFAGVDARTEEALFALLNRLKAEGKTLVMVNHNLGILDRFDSLLMINGRLVAHGPFAEAFTEKNRELTYGGRSAMIEEAERHLRIHKGDL